MNATHVPELHLADGQRVTLARRDTGARLSHALLSYVVLLIALVTLLPYEFAVPEQLAPSLAVDPMGVLGTLALFVPYGFLSRRARAGRIGEHVMVIALSAALLSAALEVAQLFERSCLASPWHILAAVAGASLGAVACARVHEGERSAAGALQAMLLQLPLMALTYLLLPLLWISAAVSEDEPARLLLTISVAMMGASLLGSIARAVRGYTPDRPWWSVPLVALLWSLLGLTPALLVDWRYGLAGIVLVVAHTSWRGRWSAPAFTERRYEAPALLAAAPFLLVYCIGAGVWPGSSFRSYPLVTLGMPVSEAGLLLVLPIVEMGIAATVLGYVAAEFHGRIGASLREIGPRILMQMAAVIMGLECARSVFGFEGASVVRAVLALGTAAYGAALYHLQRSHIVVVARRFNGLD